jgi:hypothetical protein
MPSLRWTDQVQEDLRSDGILLSLMPKGLTYVCCRRYCKYCKAGKKDEDVEHSAEMAETLPAEVAAQIRYLNVV